MPRMDHSEALEALVDEYGALDALITALDDEQLKLPSGCQGWSNKDLVFHLLLDAQRALVTFNSPAEGPPDRDFINYWNGFQASDESSHAHARFVRASAAAHVDFTEVVCPLERHCSSGDPVRQGNKEDAISGDPRPCPKDTRLHGDLGRRGMHSSP